MEEKIETLFTLQLQSIKQEAKNTSTFIFPKPDNFTWREGASIHLGNSHFDITKGKANKAFVRHLSISSLPDEGLLTITTRIPEIRSDFKEKLSKAQPGDSFTFFKPENRMELRREGKPVILISAGVGIATTRPMIRAFSISTDQIPKIFHINIDSSGNYLFQEEIKHYLQYTEGLTHIFVDSRDIFYHLLEKEVEQDGIYYIVGSDSFLLSVGKWLRSKGILQSSIILDKKQSFYEELEATEH